MDTAITVIGYIVVIAISLIVLAAVAVMFWSEGRKEDD